LFYIEARSRIIIKIHKKVFKYHIFPENGVYTMSLVDSKGRLFGLFNVIDIIIVLFVVLVLVVGIKAVFYGDEDAMTTVRLKASLQPSYIYENIKVGDAIVVNGDNSSKVLDVFVLDEVERERDILILTKLKTEIDDDGKVFFDGKELKIGKVLEYFSTERVVFEEVKVVDFGSGSDVYNYENMTITVMRSDVDPWVADALLVGSQEIVGDEVKAEVVSKEVVPYNMIIVSEDGNVYERDHPINKDVEFKVEVVARKEAGDYLYHNSELKIGSGIKLNFDGLEFKGNIIDVE